MHLSLFEEYLYIISDYFDKNPIDKHDTQQLLLYQVYQLGKAVSVLLKNDCVWQSEILKRSLGESSLIVFVISSLNEKTKSAYIALYELHGLYELLDIFEKLGFDKHKNEKEGELLHKHVEQLEEKVKRGFKSEKDEIIDRKKLKEFVRKKLSVWLYDDAKLAADTTYKDIPSLKKSVKKLLKTEGLYQAESNFTHGRYIAALMLSQKGHMVTNKNTIIRDSISRIHVAFSVMALKDKKLSLLVDNLTSIAQKVPSVLEG